MTRTFNPDHHVREASSDEDDEPAARAIPVMHSARPSKASDHGKATVQPSLNDHSSLQHHPQYLAIVVIAVIALAVAVTFTISCFILRLREKRKSAADYYPYGQLRWIHAKKLSTGSEDSEMGQVKPMEPLKPMETPKETENPTWNPESSFARPLSVLPKVRTMPRKPHRFQVLRSIPLRPQEARNTRPRLMTMLMSPSTLRGSIFGSADGSASQHGSKSTAAISSHSSAVIPPGQQSPGPPPTPRLPRNLPFASKLSFSTPLTNSPSISVWGSSQQRSSVSKMSDNDARTIYTTDSETPRFSTVSNWVQHQQRRAMQREGR